MNIYSILNAVILGLSLATILITLVAFIIYQIKRLNLNNTQKDHGYKLESIFFIRYAPHIQEKIEEWEKNQIESTSKTTKKLPFSFIKLGTLFGILAIVLILTLLTARSGKELLEQRTLDSQNEKINSFKKQGLLNKKTFSQRKTDEPFTFLDPQDLKKVTQENFEFLKKRKIGLWVSMLNPLDKESHHLSAREGWQHFLSTNQIPYELITFPEDEMLYYDLVIIPQLTTMDMTTLKKIENAKQKGTGFLFSGAVGGKALQGDKKIIQEWLQDKFGLSFWANPEPKKFQATQFVASTQSIWRFNPGQVLPIAATDNRYFAISNNEKSIQAFETNYKGIPVEREHWWVVKAVRAKSDSDNLFWVSWDPLNSDPENLNTRYIFSEVLAHIGKKPQVKVSWWPSGKTSAAVISVDTEYEFENITNILNLLTQYKFPATLFLVASMFKEHSDIFVNYTDQIELATHSDEHISFLDQVDSIQFDRIQDSRHIIEELSGTMVSGFRPPYEKMDQNTVHAASENGLKYIFGDQACISLSPCLYENDLVFFPRLLNDDFLLMKDRTLAGLTNFKDAMVKDFKQANRVGGAYFLNIHTQGFARSAYNKVVDGLFKEISNQPGLYLTTFNHLSDWWLIRRNLDAELEIDLQGRKKLRISNKGKTTAREFDVFVSLVKSSISSPRTPANDISTLCEIQLYGVQCKVSKIEGGQTLEVPLD